MSVDDLLRKIASVLDDHGEAEWGRAFEMFRSQYASEPEETKMRIWSVFGGAGSFNDIVLHTPGGLPLNTENDELDRLRRELYEQCQ
jgi:hypothetical protein